MAVTGHSLCRTQQQMIWYFKMFLSVLVVAACFVLLLLGHLGKFGHDSDFVPVYTGIVGFVLGSWFGHGQVEQRQEQQQDHGDHHV